MTAEERKEKKELKVEAWENNEIDKKRRKEMLVLRKIKDQG